MKNEINIKQSINTDTISEDFKNFNDSTAPLLENTGIERNGGVTNIYENKQTYTEIGDYSITTEGKVISLTNSSVADYKTVKIDNEIVGQVSVYGLDAELTIKEADDIFLVENGYVTCSVNGTIIVVNEYNNSQELLNTRSIEFPNISSLIQMYTSLSFVKWNNQAYGDSLEFALRLGDQVVILQESDPSISIATAIQTTNVLGINNNIYCSIVYNGQLIVAGANGRLGSYDGSNWKNYDGSGLGTGLYQSGVAGSSVLGVNAIRCMTIYTYNGV